MEAPQSITATDQIPALAFRRRERLRPVSGQGQSQLNQLPKAVGRHSFRQGINGQQPADAVGAHGSITTFENLDQRILKREAISTVFHKTTDGDRRSRGIKPLLSLEISRRTEPPSRQEATDLDATGGILELQLEDRKIRVARARETVKRRMVATMVAVVPGSSASIRRRVA